MKRSYVQINGILYEKGTEPSVDLGRGPAIQGDYPDFVSPIDGSVVRGRAGIRDHCARHNVVPTRDLDGLPHRAPEVRLSKSERTEDIRRTLIQKGY